MTLGQAIDLMEAQIASAKRRESDWRALEERLGALMLESELVGLELGLRLMNEVRESNRVSCRSLKSESQRSETAGE